MNNDPNQPNKPWEWVSFGDGSKEKTPKSITDYINRQRSKAKFYKALNSICNEVLSSRTSTTTIEPLMFEKENPQ